MAGGVRLVRVGISKMPDASGSIAVSPKASGCHQRVCGKESPAIAVTAMRGEFP